MRVVQLSYSHWLLAESTFFGRMLRTQLPASDALYHPRFNFPAATKDADTKTMKRKFDRRAKDLAPLLPSQQVRVQNHVSKKWDTPGTVIKARDNGKSYYVSFPNG